MTAASEPLNRRRVRGRAVLVVGLAGLILVAATVVDSIRLNHAGATGGNVGALSSALGCVVVLCGSMIISRNRQYRRHPVGLVLIGFGLLWSVDGLFEAWATWGETTGDRELMLLGLSNWFVDRAGAFLLVGLPLLLVIYPDGRLLPGRWRTVSITAVAMSLVLPLALLVMPAEVSALDSDRPVPAVELDLFTLPIPVDIGYPILVAARLVTFIAVIPALLVVFVRQRHGDGRERTQLRWLLWAGLVCLLAVALSLVLPSSLVANIALFGAVLATSGSVVVGILRPDLVDIDALVAATVVYAAVAATVVAVDLLVLAAASRLLGDRLDQREVTIVVLLLAVAVYGPLRSWFAARVRRVLVGRRGDRYQVVSTLAARLEDSGAVADQLPALASAVAETFKVSYVGVEIFAERGETLAAAVGSRPDGVQVVPLAYRGDEIGQITLPARGLRSMLSPGDQTLMIDLVRQAAVAIRAATLAVELQRSRDRLVRDREDDRRRIRRDLHDGLGPVLGGVALQLDAAGNSVDVDPEQSRTLIIRARAEITNALADVRRLVHGLRPPALDDLGLVAAVQQEADRARLAGVAVEVEVTDLPPLDAAVEVAAFRIVAEAVTNIIRHAGARHATVSLALTDGELMIMVADDGAGIPDEAVAGVGLLSMRERCAELGGRCLITGPVDGSTEGGGTLVRAWLPGTQRGTDDHS